MPTLKKSPDDVRIYYPNNPNKYRDINKANLKASVDTAIQANKAGMSPAYSTLSPFITIVEGNGTPFGITSNQDISDKAFLPDVIPKTVKIQKSKGSNRIGMGEIPKNSAQILILNDKVQKLQRINKGEMPMPEDVLLHYNDPRLEDNPYPSMVQETYRAIMTEAKNKEVKDIVQPLLDSLDAYRTKINSQKE